MLESKLTYPIGAGITLEQMAHDPYPTFQQLLAHEPVSWVPDYQLWMITRRDDAVEIMRNADLFTMEPDGGQINPMEDTFGKMMLSIDGPEHKRIRDAFVEPYRPKYVRSFYASLIEEITTQLITEIKQEEIVDLDKAFSDKLAIYTVVTTLGFAVNDLTQFRDWYDEFAIAIGNVTMDTSIRERGQRAFQQFRLLVLAQIDKLTIEPNQSVLSQIIHNDMAQLSAEEIVSNVALTFFGGVETTSAMLSNTIWALLSHPKQHQTVRHNPTLLANAIEESLRWEAPVQAAMRFPVRDVELHGTRLEKGTKIYCMLGAANRDPAFFAKPDQFDIKRRRANKHLSFAFGPHFCFGAPLARLEAMIGMGRLFAELPELRLHPEMPSQPYGHEFRSTASLFVKW